MLKIQVTKNDIKLGKKWDAYACPVAIATERAIKKKYKDFNKTILIGPDYLHIDWNSCFKLPKKVTKFVTEFDWSDKKVKPFSYCLPEKYLKEHCHVES
jgi:hypothetical protein